jgi:transcriptional regulator with XRE-family HTH domain
MIRHLGFAKESHKKKNLPMHIGQIIRSLREQKGWSQEKLALDAGMGTSHVSRIERGERRLPTSRLDALATALGTTPAAVYAELEGLPPPSSGATDEDGNLKVDYSPEAIELRKTFRKLSLPNRRLVVDFVNMLAKQA